MTEHNVQDTSLHRQIMNDVDYLKEENSYGCDKALKIAIRQKQEDVS